MLARVSNQKCRKKVEEAVSGPLNAKMHMYTSVPCKHAWILLCMVLHSAKICLAMGMEQSAVCVRTHACPLMCTCVHT